MLGDAIPHNTDYIADLSASHWQEAAGAIAFGSAEEKTAERPSGSAGPRTED